MKIIEIKRVDGCLEGHHVRDILFDSPITFSFIDGLSNLGKLIFRKELDKPFFKLIVRGKFTLKGSVSNVSARLILPTNDESETLDIINDYLNKV